MANGLSSGKIHPRIEILRLLGVRRLRSSPKNTPTRFPPLSTRGKSLTGEKQELTLGVFFDEKGTRLSTPDGLPLVTISTRSAIKRVVMRRGETPNSIHLLQSDGATVEEFHIHGLDKIIPLNAGGIDMGGQTVPIHDGSPIGR